MTKDDILKLKSAFLYLLKKSSSVDMYHLLKILYFANKEHLVQYGRTITNDTVCALPKGPVSSELYDTIKTKKGQDVKTWGFNTQDYDSITSSFSISGHKLIALEDYDTDELSKTDMAMLDFAYDKYINVDCEELHRLSSDSAYTKAKSRGFNTPLNIKDIAQAGGSSNEMLDYIAEIQDLIAM